jgi:hypothetical protein
VPVAAVLVLLLTGAAWTAYDRWVSPASPAYATALHAAEAVTPLPPGHTWTLPASLTAGTQDGVPVMTSVDGARLLVTLQAICHWESAWSDAIDQRNATGRARSAAAFDLLVSRIRVHVEGTSEDVPSMDAAGIARYHEIAATAHTGDATGLQEDLAINCPSAVRQPTRW